MPFLPEATDKKYRKWDNHYYSISGITDAETWQKAERTKDPRDVELVLRYLTHKQGCWHPYPHYVLKNFDYLLSEARHDPVASRHPVTEEQRELAIKISYSTPEIPEEYVAQCHVLFTQFLEKLNESESCVELYTVLPAATLFTETWFTDIAPRGHWSSRRFSLSDSRFLSYIKAHCNNIGLPSTHVIGVYCGKPKPNYLS